MNDLFIIILLCLSCACIYIFEISKNKKTLLACRITLVLFITGVVMLGYDNYRLKREASIASRLIFHPETIVSLLNYFRNILLLTFELVSIHICLPFIYK